MNLLGAKLYDPTTAVSLGTVASAMAVFDTTNARIAFVVPPSGFVRVVVEVTIHGATTYSQILLGVMEGATVRGKVAPRVTLGATATATVMLRARADFIVPGQTPGASVNWDAAWGIETFVASSLIKYGGPANATANNDFGALQFEIWDPCPEYTPTSGTAPTSTVHVKVDGIKTKTDFLPSATAGAAGGVFIAGTNAATTITTALTTTFTGNLTGSVGSVTGAVGSVTGAVGSVTGAVGSIASGGIAAASFAAGAINAAAIADAAIDTATFAAGTTIPRCTLTDTLTTYTGNTVQTGDSFARIGANGAGLTAVALTGTQTFNNTGTWTGNIVGTLSTLTTYTGNTPQTGDSFARIGAAGAGLTALGDTRIANLDAAVTTRMATYTQPTGFLTATFPSDPADQSLVIAATDALMTRIGANGAGLTALGDARLANLDAAISTRSTLTTGDIPTDVANAEAVLKFDLSTLTGEASRSPANALRFLRNRWAVTGTVLSVKKEDDTTEAWTATLSTAPGAEPIIGVDPV